MTLPLGTYAYSQLPDEFDNSVADPFAMLLQNPDAQLIYLIELYPYDSTLPKTLYGIAPLGTSAYSQFDFTYNGGINPVYLSDVGFITEPGDTLVSQYFRACVDNPLQYETSVFSGSDFSGGNQSFGAVVITNGGGEMDFLEKYFWGSRRVVVKAGARGFAYSDFAIVFDGAASGIDADEERITITVRDNRVKTDQYLVPANYAGTGGLEGGADIANKPKPLCYGAVNNAEPVLINASNLIYQIHDGSISYVTAVRDSGVSLTNAGDVTDIMTAAVPAGNFKTDLSRGLIKLGSTPSGRITVDVLGENGYTGYVSKIGDIISRILKTRLGASSLDDASIDSGSLNRLNIEIPGPAGIYITDRITASSVLDELVLPVGAYWTFTRQGQLVVGIIDEPGTPTFTVTADNIDETGIRIVSTMQAAWRISVGYAPASVVQNEDELAGGTTVADRAFVTQEYRFVTFENEAILNQNIQATERVFLTRLANMADAQALLTRLSNIYTTRRRVYEAPTYRSLFRLYLGDTTKLVYNRFGMDAGANLRVVGIREDAETGLTSLELWG